MAKAYQYTADGYFAGKSEDYGLLPNNATYTAPQERKGYVPRWTGEAWEYVENHKGQEGYVDGQPFAVNEYGPLPDGWSDTLPPPTQDELDAKRRTEILALLKEIDADSVRPLRAIANGQAVQEDHDKLAALDAEAVKLRLELAATGTV